MTTATRPAARNAEALNAETSVPGPPPTPYLRLDLGIAAARYGQLQAVLPGTAIHYAVKANPHPQLLRLLVTLGASFDVASPAEVLACLAAGASTEQLVYSNPIKAQSDLVAAYGLGVRLFVVDCLPELAKVARDAPGSSVLCRLLTSGAGSDWPLSRKYGCSAADCLQILIAARHLGLDPAGVAFHVGSQQRDPGRWGAPIAAAADIFADLRRCGIEPWLLDLGGGFPADHEGDHPATAAYGEVIESFLSAEFGSHRPRTLAEPGRTLVADAGELVSTVIAVCWRGERRWVYLDAGVFTGLVETLDEAIRYRISTTSDGGPTGPVVLAGPTCDSADVLYEKSPVWLPLALGEGDEVVLHSAGAYTTCYSTVGFNGFAPLRTYLRPREVRVLER